MCDGLATVAVAPSPNCQLRDVTSPVVRSVKLTLSGAPPVTGVALKSTTGAGCSGTTVTGSVTVLLARLVSPVVPYGLTTTLTAVTPPKFSVFQSSAAGALAPAARLAT